MTAGSDAWTVHDHGPIERLEDNLWRVEGQVPKTPLRRVMTVARTGEGELVIHSAIALEEPLMKEVEAFGRPRYLVVPSRFHRMDAPAFKRRYPALEVVCPRAVRRRVEGVVPVDLTVEAFPQGGDVQLRHLEGTAEREGVMIVRHGAAATLVFNDVVFNMPHLSGVRGFALKHLAASSGGPRVSRIAKMLIIDDAAAMSADLKELAGTPGLKRLIVSHHEMVESDPAGVLRSLLP